MVHDFVALLLLEIEFGVEVLVLSLQNFVDRNVLLSGLYAVVADQSFDLVKFRLPDLESPLDQYALNLVAQEVFVVPLAGLFKALLSSHSGPELDVSPLFGGQRELVHKSIVFVKFVDVLLYPPYQFCLGRQLLSL